MQSYHDTISAALDQLTIGLRPYIEARLAATFPESWRDVAGGSFRDGRDRISEHGEIDWDAHSLLTVMWDQWNAVFRADLGHQERSLVSELRTVRNGWAHQREFDFDDAFRVLDSVRRLLSAINAPNTGEINRQKQELLESYVAEQVNTQVQRAAFNRGKLWIISIYSLCCAAVFYHVAATGSYGSSALIAFVLLVFVYLIYEQFKMEPPLLYGPRECLRCKRIIYRKQCPYCEPQTAPGSMVRAT